MVVIIRQRLSNNRWRSCNANCYNAKGDACTCICNGINHGKGLDGALSTNTNKMVQGLLNRKGIIGVQVKLPIVQEHLPTEVV